MVAFQLWGLDFDFASLISFLIGIFAGFALLAIIYAILVVSSIKSKKYIAKSNVVDITDEMVLEIVDNAKKVFSDKKIKGAKNSVSHCWTICCNLVVDIATKFFPKSKHPAAELTIDEILELLIYVSNRINEIVDRPGLRLVKKLKLSTIISFGDAKKFIEDSPLMKITKKYKIKQALGKIFGFLNLLNPIYWVRRLAVNTTLDIAVNKLCLSVISIVGEEVYKIYSKRVFDEERIIDTKVDELLTSMEQDLENVTDDEVEDYIASQGLEEAISKKRKV